MADGIKKTNSGATGETQLTGSEWLDLWSEGKGHQSDRSPLPYFSYFGDCFSEMGRKLLEKLLGKGF